MLLSNPQNSFGPFTLMLSNDTPLWELDVSTVFLTKQRLIDNNKLNKIRIYEDH